MPSTESKPNSLAFAVAHYGPDIGPASRRLVRIELVLWANQRGLALAEVFEANSNAQEIHEIQALRNVLDTYADQTTTLVAYGKVHLAALEGIAERYGLEVIHFNSGWAARLPAGMSPATVVPAPDRPAGESLPEGVVLLPDLAAEFTQLTGSPPASPASPRRGSTQRRRRWA